MIFNDNIKYLRSEMDLLNLSDTEFVQQIRNLSKKQMEDLANNFSKKFDLLRREYNLKKDLPTPITTSTPQTPVVTSSVRSPKSRRRSPSPRRTSTSFISDMIGILEKKPINYYGNKLILTNSSTSGTIQIILYPTYNIEYIQNTNVKEPLSRYVHKTNGTGSIPLENLSEVLSDLIKLGWLPA